MARMIRKQVYLKSQQERKLRRLADRWECTEAEVLRLAIDRMPDAEGAMIERLAAAGLLAPTPQDDDLNHGESVEELERWHESSIRTRTEALGLLEAVLEDRR